MTKTKIKKESFWVRNKKSEGYLLKKKLMKILINVCRFILLFGLCFLILQPLLNKISVAFMTEEDLLDPIVVSVPVHFTLNNFEVCNEIMHYWESFRNSFITSITLSILQVGVCTLVGYGFARFKFPLKNLWFAFVMAVVIIPPQIISTSLHLHFRFFDIFGIIKLITGNSLNLKTSVVPYYLMSAGCMGLKNGLYIYMIRQFFRNIPNDMEEAAYVDGCGMFRTFYKIMLPEGKPIITSCFLFSFVWQWTDGFYSKMFLGGKRLVSISIAGVVDELGSYIAKFTGIRSSVSVSYSNCILSTGTLMVIIPVVVLYLFAQRQFVESISSTGIKM